MRTDKPIETEGEKKNLNGAHIQDESDSEGSFGEERSGFLDRLGMKIDDGLHSVFTAYVFLFSYR
ncbi:unnamed protein product, partial [Rotaria sp. Silwood2]